MAMKTFELSQEQAEKIPAFYFPGCEDDYKSGLDLESRNDAIDNPLYSL